MMYVQRMVRGITFLLVLAASVAVSADEQSADSINTRYPDSSQAIPIPGIVVRSQRLPVIAAELPAAVQVIEMSKTQQVNNVSISSVAGTVSGIRAYPLGNLWGRSVVDIRGFYGGGQAQYLYVTLNGIPLNNISSGLVDWTSIDGSSINRMEIIKGPVSTQYGDFGFGGLLALYAEPQKNTTPFSVSILGGSNNAYSSVVSWDKQVSDYAMSLTSSLKKSDGWREHSQFENQNVFLHLDKTKGKSSTSIILGYSHIDEDYPGALTQSELDSNRNGVALDMLGQPIRDNEKIKKIVSGVSYITPLTDAVTMKPKVFVNWTDADRVVTIGAPLRHTPKEISSGAEISFQAQPQLFERPLSIAFGAGFDYGNLKTEYNNIMDAENPFLLSKGSGKRWVASVFFTGVYAVTKQMSLSAGIRIDNIHTNFDFEPSVAIPSGMSVSQNENCISPKLALNYKITSTLSYYASVSGAFKAPTLSHLYDSPPIYNPFTESYIMISNNNLKSLRGTSIETGMKLHNAHGWSADINGFYYAIRNEIDFDNATFSYANISKSRHVGMELSVSKTFWNNLATQGSLAYNSSTFRDGDFTGNQINGVPQFSYSAGLTYTVHNNGYVGIRGTGITKQYVDQENQHRLDDYVNFQLFTSYTVSPLTFTLQVDNIFDTQYNYDGYFDPMAGQIMYIPAPTRKISVSVVSAF